jgi:hypothetical protein
MKKQTREEQVLRARLEEAYLDVVGGWGADISRVRQHNDPIPTLAYLYGYRFVEFAVNARIDPYALIGPDGEVVKVWPTKPPSLAELSEVIEGV